VDLSGRRRRHAGRLVAHLASHGLQTLPQPQVRDKRTAPVTVFCALWYVCIVECPRHMPVIFLVYSGPRCRRHLRNNFTPVFCGALGVPRSQMQDNSQFLADTRLVMAMRLASQGWYDWKQYADSTRRPFSWATSGRFLQPILGGRLGLKGTRGCTRRRSSFRCRRWRSRPGPTSRPFWEEDTTVLGRAVLLNMHELCVSMRRQFKVPPPKP